jgi:hypothetical protein
MIHRRGIGSGSQEVVERFHGVAAAEAADLEQITAHAGQQRLDRSNRGTVAPDHDGEAAVRRARHAAGDRGIEQRDVAPCELLSERAGTDGIGRTHVDHDRAGAQIGGEGTALRLQQRLAHLVAGRQHGDHDIGVARHLGEAFSCPTRVRLRKAVRAFGSNVVGHHVVAAAHEIGGHGRTHIAETDEPDASRLAHCSPVMLTAAEAGIMSPLWPRRKPAFRLGACAGGRDGGWSRPVSRKGAGRGRYRLALGLVHGGCRRGPDRAQRRAA